MHENTETDPEADPETDLDHPVLLDQVEHLKRALEGARIIGPAIGIVMARTQRTYGQAFEHLSHLSQLRHQKLREVAAWILETGEIPGARQPSVTAGE